MATYHRMDSLFTKASASLLTNNLAVKLNADTCGADLLFVHKSAVHLLLSGTEPNPCYSHRSVVCKIPTSNQEISYVMILQADWVEVAGRKILVLATQKGIKMYEWDGSTLMYWHGFGASGDSYLFTRGITSIGSNTICIGTSTGQLLVFNVPAKGGNITFEESLAGHNHPITVVVARGNNLVSADEHGDIVIRKHIDGESFKTNTKISGSNLPCNCVDMWKNILVAGYSSGEIRLFDINKGILLGHIDAHARAINGLHIAQGSGMCVTCGEDSFVRVWEIKSAQTLEVRLDYSDRIPDQLLVGAQFTDNDGNKFAVNAYDSQEVFMFSKE